MNRDLSQRKPLPSKLDNVARRLGVSDHVIDWQRKTDGRSNHVLTEVFILKLNSPPYAVVIKLAGEHQSSKEAITIERETLNIITEATSNSRLAAPQLFPAPGLNHDELAMTYLPGTKLENYAGTSLDTTPLAKELVYTLKELWRHNSSGNDNDHSDRMVLRLQGVLAEELENELLDWYSKRKQSLKTIKPTLIHGDLRPANIMVIEKDDQIHLSGLVDFAKSRTDKPTMDIVMMEYTFSPILKSLFDKIEDLLAPIDMQDLIDAKIILLCELIFGCTNMRDWEGFNRNCTSLSSLLKTID